jgi:hypothetical protein
MYRRSVIEGPGERVEPRQAYVGIRAEGYMP